jgi:hypothetical protein
VTETQTLDSQNEESKPPSKKHKRAVPLGSRMPVDEAKQELLPRQDTTTPASTEIYAPYYKRTSDFATLVSEAWAVVTRASLISCHRRAISALPYSPRDPLRTGAGASA